MAEPDKVKQYIQLEGDGAAGRLCYKALFLCHHCFQKMLQAPTFVHFIRDPLLS